MHPHPKALSRFPQTGKSSPQFVDVRQLKLLVSFLHGLVITDCLRRYKEVWRGIRKTTYTEERLGCGSTDISSSDKLVGVRYGKFNFTPIVINLEIDNACNNSRKVKSYPQHIMFCRIFCPFYDRLSCFVISRLIPGFNGHAEEFRADFVFCRFSWG